MPSNHFVTARNLSDSRSEASVRAPHVSTLPVAAIAPAMVTDMQCLTAGMTMTSWHSPGIVTPFGAFYAEAYRRACALVAARRSAERRAGKINFVTARN